MKGSLLGFVSNKKVSLSSKTNVGTNFRKVDVPKEWAESRGIRYAKPTDLFKEDTYAPEGQRIAPKHIYRELNKSEIGKETIDLIEKNQIKVRLDYGEIPTDQAGNRIYGLANTSTNTARIFVRATESVSVTARTIIHEVTHNSLNNANYTQREEVMAFMRELKHVKDKLKYSEVRAIIEEVKTIYPDIPYR